MFNAYVIKTAAWGRVYYNTQPPHLWNLEIADSTFTRELRSLPTNKKGMSWFTQKLTDGEA